jgi:ABC-2 type transport system ATP-binding protein
LKTITKSLVEEVRTKAERDLAMNETIIVVDRLTKLFGNVHAVEDLSLSIDSGQIFGFLRANGARKTTTMRMLCGLTRPTSGRATIGGADVWLER